MDSQALWEFLNELLSKMFEPTYMACAAIASCLTAILLYVIYYRPDDEENFDRNFNREAINIMHGADNNNKKKAAPTAAKLTKKEKKKQQQQQQQRVTPDLTEDEQQAERNVVQPTTTAPAPVAAPAPAPAPAAAAPANTPSPVRQQPRVQEQHQQQAPKETVQQVKEEPAKKKPTKPVNAATLNKNNVFQHLRTLPDLDPAYVKFVSDALALAESQKNSLTTENKALRGKIQDGKATAEKLEKAEANVKEERTQKASLSAQLKTLQANEANLSRKVQENAASARVRDEEHAKEAQALRAKIQQLEAESNSSKSFHTKTTGQLRTAQNQLREAQQKMEQQKQAFDKEISARDEQKKKDFTNMEHLATVVGMAEKQCEAAGLELNELRQANQELEQMNADLMENFNAARHNQSEQDTELKAELAKLREEKAQWTAEKKLMIEKYVRLEELIKELNKDISEFHGYKEQHEKIVADLTRREQDHLAVVEHYKGIESEKADLLKQVSEGKEKLAEAVNALEAEKARVVEIPMNNSAAKEEMEEVFELKRTHVDLASAPSTSNDAAEVEKLKAQNAELQEKNTELRQRNMTILEKTEAMPNQLVNERKLVAAKIAKVSKTSFKAFDDEKAYANFVETSVSEIEKGLSAKPAAAAPSVPTTQKQAPSSSTPAGNENVCYRTLQAVHQELCRIQELAEKEERQRAATQHA